MFLLAVPGVGEIGIGVGVVLWALFALSFWQPLEAAIAGLVVYSLWWLGQLVFTPLLALDGILLRVLVLWALMASAGAEWNMKRRRDAVVRSRT